MNGFLGLGYLLSIASTAGWADDWQKNSGRRAVTVQTPDAGVSRTTHWHSVLTILVFTAAACLAAMKLSLWLDEVLQLTVTRSGLGLSSFLTSVAKNAGGAPLGYLTQGAFIRLFGDSPFAMRLPSILSGVLACLGFSAAASQAKLSRPAGALLLFSFLPLHFRYATEARPYEQALCLSIWVTVMFQRLVERPDLKTAVTYAVLASAAIYTQPFSFFVVLAQLIWVAFTRNAKRTPNLEKTFRLCGLAAFLSAASFVPWFCFARGQWLQAVLGSAKSQINLRVLAVLGHELSGAGYIGTAMLVILVIVGVGLSTKPRADRLFWVVSCVVPIVLAVIADLAFGYFFAIRQVIFALPALSVMAAMGYEKLAARKPRVTAVVAVTTLAGFVYANVDFVMKAREDWQKTALLIDVQLWDSDACYVALPDSAASLYETFRPWLKLRRCKSPITYKKIVLATSAYSAAEDIATEDEILQTAGFQLIIPPLIARPLVQIWREPLSENVKVRTPGAVEPWQFLGGHSPGHLRE